MREETGQGIQNWTLLGCVTYRRGQDITLCPRQRTEPQGRSTATKKHHRILITRNKRYQPFPGIGNLIHGSGCELC